MPHPFRWLLAAAVTLVAFQPAEAVIKKLTPLKDVIGDATLIVAAEVQKVDPAKPSVIFKFEENLKGKCEFATFPVNLKGDSFAKKDDHPKAMLDRLSPGRKLLLFVTKVEKTYVTFGFLEGTWFQVRGTVGDDGKAVTWAFLHCEPYFRRTFKGTTAELRAVVEKAVSGKQAPPEANEKEEPGLGPVPEKKGLARRSPTLFGVIPTTVLVAPLAVVAALFPGLFARLAVAIKQWRAFLTVASVNTTLATLYFLVREWLPDWWAFSPQGFLVYVIGVTLVGLLWSGRRYRRTAAEDATVTATPSKTTLLALLGVLGGLGLSLLVVAWWLGDRTKLLEAPWREFTALAVGVVAVLVYSLYRIATRATDGPDARTRLSISGESFGLFGVLVFSAATFLNGFPRGPVVGGEQGDAPEGTVGPKLVDVQAMTFPGAYEVMSGIVVGPDGRIFFGAESAGGTGSVWCADPATGRPVWKFTNGGDLQPVYCTPTVVNGKVYVGEGLHTDSERRMFCLNAATGDPHWNFKTESHTEGRAVFAGGRLIFSAGDDGLICIDPETRQKKWHVAGLSQKLHVDTPPAVLGRRVFFGSGYNTLAILCADVNTGDVLWRTPVDLRSFGAPLARNKFVYYGLGTGNLVQDLSDEKEDAGVPVERVAKGAVMCVSADTGEVVWRYDLPKSVHTEMAADLRTVYACCKDGFVYALDRASGKLRWKRSVGPAFAAGPVVSTHANGAATLAVYAVSIDGRVMCLNPATGEPFWVRDLGEYAKKTLEVLSTPALVSTENGAKRVLYVGAKAENKNNGERVATVFRIEDVVED